HHPARLPSPTDQLASLPYPLKLSAFQKDDYFTQANGMNILGMLKNPMVLMMLFSGVLMWGMPKLIANMEMDEETVAEVAQTRKRVANMQNMDWTESLSTMLAGGKKEETSAMPLPLPATPGAATPAKSSGPSGALKGQGGGKKRGKGK
ncbi:ER membrane protein complex subunit 7, partial [Tremellales sp. Uapishka_1]